MNEDNLKRLLDLYIKEPRIRDYSIPRIAKNQCGAASRSLQTYLKDHGIDAALICVQGLKSNPNPSEAHHLTPEEWRHFGHTVVVVENIWIDLTARQMSEDYAFPYVTDAWTECQNWIHLDLT